MVRAAMGAFISFHRHPKIRNQVCGYPDAARCRYENSDDDEICPTSRTSQTGRNRGGDHLHFPNILHLFMLNRPGIGEACAIPRPVI
jgi:hypothetical protein